MTNGLIKLNLPLKTKGIDFEHEGRLTKTIEEDSQLWQLKQNNQERVVAVVHLQLPHELQWRGVAHHPDPGTRQNILNICNSKITLITFVFFTSLSPIPNN